MNPSLVAETVRNRLAVLIDVPPAAIGDETPFEELDVDSLMLLELVALIEKHLGFELPEQDLSKFKTIHDVERYVSLVPRD
jgi:acyl carrier protein